MWGSEKGGQAVSLGGCRVLWQVGESKFSGGMATPLAFKHSVWSLLTSEWIALLQMENAFSDFEIITHSWKL